MVDSSGEDPFKGVEVAENGIINVGMTKIPLK